MNKKKLLDIIFKYKVVLLFIVLCVGAIIAAKQPMTFVVGEVVTRIGRNSFVVLALIIPILAGMGLNFGIIIGAMCAQVALFLTTYWGFTGITGFLLTALIATPLGVLFGFLVGKLFNQMKGAEMIGGLVLGYFAEGIYQLLFLFIFGGVIAFHSSKLMIATGVGVKNAIDLKDTIKYALDTVPMISLIEIAFYVVVALVVIATAVRLIKKQSVDWKRQLGTLGAAVAVYALTFIPAVEGFLSVDRLLLLWAVEIAVIATIVWQVFQLVRHKVIRKDKWDFRRPLVYCLVALVGYGLTYVPPIYEVLLAVRLPITTFVCILALCGFNTALMKTRLGQNMRTVGQDRTVATAAGINVNRTRIIAMIISTVLASWGQLIFLQNVGTLSTYGAHVQVATFAIASLLVGGASVQKATNKQALLGVVLFHTLFSMAPLAGNELFGNPAIGEYFRLFVSYAIIAMALAMHAWKKKEKPNLQAPKNQDKDTPPAVDAAL